MAKRKTAKPAPASSAGNIRCAGDRVPVGSLTPDPRNARRHDERNVQSVMDSYRMSGQRKPIVVADGVVIAGNCQLEAAKRLGWPEIAVTDASDMSETQRRAYAIADNRTAELAEWDDEELTRQLKALADEDYDLTMVGFDDREVDALLANVEPVLPPTIAASEKPYMTMFFRVPADKRASVESALRDASKRHNGEGDMSAFSRGLLVLCGVK